MFSEARQPINTLRNLQRSIMHGGERAFELVPMSLKTLIEHKVWKECHDKNGQPFKSFEAFAAAPFWFGLNSTVNELKAFCIKHDDVRRLIDEAVDPAPLVDYSEAGAKGGRGNKASDNITGFRGTDPTYTLKRLKRDRPDLAEKVVRGELSAHAAAIDAGFRKQPTPLEIILKQLPKLTQHEREQLRDILETPP
jgi:hypothetical protein